MHNHFATVQASRYQTLGLQMNLLLSAATTAGKRSVPTHSPVFCFTKMSEKDASLPAIPRWKFRWVALVFTALAGLAFAGLWADAWVAKNWDSEGLPGDLVQGIQLSEAFAHGFGVLVALCLVGFLAPTHRKFLPRLAGCAFFSGLAAQGLKQIIARERPSNLNSIIPDNISESWYGFMPDWRQFEVESAFQSFPSAHTATAVGLAIGLSWLFPLGRFVFFSLAILASFQRISCGAHWTSDVLAGAALAVVVCYIIFQWGLWEESIKARREMKRRGIKPPEITELKSDQRIAA